MQGLGASQHGRQSLKGGAHNVDMGLLRRQARARRLRVEAQLERARVPRREALPHELGVESPGRAEFGDLLEEVAIRAEEEGQPGRERVHFQPGPARRFDIRDGVGQREGKFLGCRGAGLAHVVAADRDRVPARSMLGRPCQHVGHNAHGCRWRVDVGPARNVLLEDVVLDGAAQRAVRHSGALGDDRVEG